MKPRVLTLRDLNRATLQRQMLLERTSMAVPAAVERLIAMQAQEPRPPFVGLWTRLRDFQREELARRIEDRTIVRATFIRGTLHLVTAEDYRLLRATIQPALDAAGGAIRKQRSQTFDLDRIYAMGREYIGAEPRTFAEISAMFEEQVPGADVGAMRYSVRMNLPMVQVPVSNGWSFPSTPRFTLADTWLGKPLTDTPDLRTLVHRYLAAFGPATVNDIQTWSGLPKLKDAVDKLKPDLQIYHDEKGRELLDVPGAPLPDAETPAPERFLPEFDNLLLSHDKRTRVVADAHRPKVYLPGLRVAATFLVDGFVRGAWKVEKTKGVATLVITPFEPLTKVNRAALQDEAERLVRFVEADAKAYDVRFAE